mgnify:CR=1 FL=1
MKKIVFLLGVILFISCNSNETTNQQLKAAVSDQF